jgi:hypothetical protein
MRYTCEICGAHLDAGEHCDCVDHDQPEIETAQRREIRSGEGDSLDPNFLRRYRAWLES